MLPAHRRPYLNVIRLGIAVPVLALVVMLLDARLRPTAYVFRYENVLGTSMDLTVLADSEPAARAGEATVLRQIDHDARILSGYDRDSEFSRWFRTREKAITISPELFEVLGLFDTWRARTGGALEASTERMALVWKGAARTQRIPSKAELAGAVRDVQRVHWRLDAAARTATHLSETPILLNSFTKSYIVDRAARTALATKSIHGVVVNIGGDLAVRGDRTEIVQVTDPQDSFENGRSLAQLVIRDRAVATSGGYRRGFDVAGQHYSHIIDPRTGWPTGHVLSATVVANDAVDAGALATALCVVSPAEGERLASQRPGTEFSMVLTNGRRIESRGWRALELQRARLLTPPNPIARVYASEQTWNPEFELTVTVELARPGGMAKRPYVAIWIEDADRRPVRTIALLFQKSRYLPELRAWYRGDRQRATLEATEIIDSVASATRSPGSYSFKWDGKDQRGNLVKPGTYSIVVEVVREHGTYQIIRQGMDFSGVPARIDLPGGTEVTAASLDYHRIAGR